MFAKSGKKEIWLGIGGDSNKPEIEIEWGNDRHASVSFKKLIDDLMESHEYVGANMGLRYDLALSDTLDSMSGVLKKAIKKVNRAANS